MHVFNNIPSVSEPKNVTDEARNKLLYVLYLDDESDTQYRHSPISYRTNLPPKLFTGQRPNTGFLDPIMKYRG